MAQASEVVSGRVRGRIIAGLLGTGFLVLCLWPHAGRLAHPSLFSDDLIRIARLQTAPLPDLLFRPFNEHVAPLFELVSWTTWQLCGRRLVLAPAAFTVASLVPFLLCLAAIRVMVRRETGSMTAALAAVAAFSLSAVHLEAAWWYSASSFTWALLGTLLGLIWVGRAVDSAETGERDSTWWMAGAVAAVAAAPAFSAIGLLAGPACTLRAIVDSRLVGRRKLGALTPLAGSAFYLAVAGVFRYGAIMKESVHRNADLGTGLLTTLRASIDVLIPGLMGQGNLDRWIGGGLDLAMGAVAMVAIGVWGWKSQARPAIFTGLFLILGGYGMTYSVRNQYGTHWLMEVQRYHLFPQLGLVVIAASIPGRWLGRFNASPRAGLMLATAVAGVVLGLHLPRMQSAARMLRFPDQARTLAAIDGLERICRARGITRGQAIAALDPIHRRWFPHEPNILEVLPDMANSSALPDNQVRAALLGGLRLPDREALCGGMNASQLLVGADGAMDSGTLSLGALVGSFGVHSDGPGRWRTAAGPAFLEFQFADDGDPDVPEHARLLCVPGLDLAGEVEVWWAGKRDAWTETRSVRLGPLAQPAAQARATDWAVPLARVPHWSAPHVSRIRMIVRSETPLAVEAPRLVR